MILNNEVLSPPVSTRFQTSEVSAGTKMPHDPSLKTFHAAYIGRSEKIRTSGLLVPNQARYHLRYTPICSPV